MINGKVIKAIIPARMTSSRLPGKVMLDICGKPSLQRVIERVRAAKLLDGIVIAITTNKEDDCLEEFCKAINCEYFRGSENNVLDRIIQAAKKSNTDVIVELTSDCPLIYWEHIDTLVDMHMKNYPYYDMTTNILTRTFPRGFDIRIVNIESLEKSFKEIDNELDFEHALTWIYLNPKGKQNYKVQNWDAPCPEFRPDIEVTLDAPEDLEFIRWLYGFEKQGYNLALTCRDVINLINTYPGEYAKISKVQRKDYFIELSETYAKQKNIEGAKQNEQIQGSDNRDRKARSRGRPRKS